MLLIVLFLFSCFYAPQTLDAHVTVVYDEVEINGKNPYRK